MAGPFSISVGAASFTCLGAGAEASLQPAGNPDVVLPPPPSPHPISPEATRMPATAAAIAVRPMIKARKPTRSACDDRRMPPSQSEPEPPPRSVRMTGRAINALVARAPFTWPLLRGWSHRYWENIASTWGERVDRSGPEYLAPLAAALLRVRPEPERALDVGTGLGDGALLIAREFPHARVRGVDLSEEMVRRAQSRIGLDPEGRVAFKVADASDLPFEEESFDLVAQLNVPPFFGEIARVLRPGGFAVVAASWGPATPFYTPDAVLDHGFRRHGMEKFESGEAAQGTWFIARRPSVAQ